MVELLERLRNSPLMRELLESSGGSAPGATADPLSDPRPTNLSCFDHVVAVLPEFDLRAFQEPTGEDLRAMTVPARQ